MGVSLLLDCMRVRTEGGSTSKAPLAAVPFRDSRDSDMMRANSRLNSSSISGSTLRFKRITSSSSSSSTGSSAVST
jgi:hypothetical protein